MKFSRMAVLFLGIGLLGARAQQAAQCTAAPADATKARAAAEVALHLKWPLPVLRSTPIESTDGFRGALLLASGSVFQIETITWQIDSSGALGIAEFEGYAADGTRSSFTKSGVPGRRIESLFEMSDFTLGNPHGQGKAQKIDSIRFATDRDGFLAISRLSGVDAKTGEKVDLDPDQGPGTGTPVACGLRVQMDCYQATCQGGACGPAPGCGCGGSSGGCRSVTDSVCFGSCPFGFVCNGSVNNCSCIQNPPPPTKNPPIGPPTNPPGGGESSTPEP